MMFYTAAAMNSAPGFYKGKKNLVGAIIQPRSDTPLSHTVITRQEIKWFVEDLQNAVVKALRARSAAGAKARWCRLVPGQDRLPALDRANAVSWRKHPTPRT